LDIIYTKDKISVTLQIMQIGFFQYIFYQYSIIWIQLTFYFLNFIIRWSILGSTFLSKSLYIYNDIKKVIQYFLIDIFKLVWNLIFPVNSWIAGWVAFKKTSYGDLWEISYGDRPSQRSVIAHKWLLQLILIFSMSYYNYLAIFCLKKSFITIT